MYLATRSSEVTVSSLFALPAERKLLLTGWKRIQYCGEIPYITLIQTPLDNSHTRIVLSSDDDAMY
jgi:hypothetical protein